MKYKIYKLIHNDEIIYVGRTKLTLKRRKSGRYRNIPLETKQESLIELIEETDDITREEYWRSYYINLGCNLYNKYKGSSGLERKEYVKEYQKTEKRKIYCKEYGKNWYENNKDYFKTEERKEYMSEYRKINKIN